MPALTLTPLMTCWFNFLAARSEPGGPPAGLTDAEIISRFPLVTGLFTLLLLLGLACDLWLIYRWRQHRSTDRFKVALQPWGYSQLAILGIAYISLSLLVAFSAVLFPGDDELAWFLLLGGNLSMNLLILVGLVAYLRYRGLAVREVLGLTPATRAGAGSRAVIFYLAMIPPLTVATALSASLCYLLKIQPSSQPVVELITTSDSPLLLGLVIFLAVAAAPVAEEVLFRGFAYPALKRRLGMERALVVVSLLFAIVHLHAPSAVPLFALGMAFGLAYELSGTILVPILMHSLFNTANVLMMLYVRTHS